LSRFPIAVAIVIAAGASLFGVYWFGAYSYATGTWPAIKFESLKFNALQALEGFGIKYDDHARLIAFSDKTPIACPAQTDRTAVFLIVGQSNASNAGGQRFRSVTGRVAGYFEGKCSIAASPLLGTSGTAGEPWSAVGDRLVSSGSFDEVVLIPAAIGGSGLSEWIAGGDLHSMLQQTVQDAQQHYRITHVLWHQGESDLLLGTNEDAYVSEFQSLASDLRKWGVTAPIYVSVATRCQQPEGQWSPDNPISRAQRRLGNSGEGFAPGIDTDALLTAIDRSDGCHFGGSGMAKVIAAWTEILRRK
jgi:Carbohydrate esterase, sialic acid-specific acetylesterase